MYFLQVYYVDIRKWIRQCYFCRYKYFFFKNRLYVLVQICIFLYIFYYGYFFMLLNVFLYSFSGCVFNIISFLKLNIYIVFNLILLFNNYKGRTL